MRHFHRLGKQIRGEFQPLEAPDCPKTGFNYIVRPEIPALCTNPPSFVPRGGTNVPGFFTPFQGLSTIIRMAACDLSSSLILNGVN
jgi:hypothetical protein